MPISIDAAAPNTLDHSLQGAWQRKEDSQLFAFCVDDATSFWPANCRRPHSFEVLGSAGVTKESVAAAFRQVGDCGVGVIRRPGSRGTSPPRSCRRVPHPWRRTSDHWARRHDRGQWVLQQLPHEPH